MKKVISILVFLPFFIATPALALTQNQVNAIIQFLVAFNADPSIISSVQLDLQSSVSSSTPATVSTTTPPTITSPKIIITPTTVYVPTQSPNLQPVQQPVLQQQTFGSIQNTVALPTPTCTLTASSTEDGTPYRSVVITWTSSNVSSGIISSYHNWGDNQQWLPNTDLSILSDVNNATSSISGGTYSHLSADHSGTWYRIKFTGQYGSVTCDASVGKDPLW